MGEFGSFNTRVFHWTDAGSKKPTRPEDPYNYLAGFGNEFESEVIPGALPIGQNSPQLCAYGLYAEQITGTSFAAPRVGSMRNFVYRRRPACIHGETIKTKSNTSVTSAFMNPSENVQNIPAQVCWSPFPIPDQAAGPVDFADGLHTLGGSGQPNVREGLAYHVFAINSNMQNKAFANMDGDFLFVAQEGHLDITTEFGHIYLQPSEICVIQQGLRFKIEMVEGKSPNGARGYIIETWGSRWELPELGPLGGYGLANSRDFLHPVADIDTKSSGAWNIISKQGGEYYTTSQNHTPFDVVAWHGNYIPFKYDLSKFVYHNTVSVDHTDPCINTVLTARSRDPHAPLCDFLTFGPRWDVAEHTFRPPYFHRNCASEFLARIYGPEGTGGRSEIFSPGGASYESGYTPHGSGDQRTVGAMHATMKAMRVGENQLTFMLESCRSLLFTQWALKDCGVLVAENVPESAWELLPDRFGQNEEAIRLLKEIGKL